eukprot:PhM_4_TR18660/c3_g1_i2/m.19874
MNVPRLYFMTTNQNQNQSNEQNHHHHHHHQLRTSSVPQHHQPAQVRPTRARSSRTVPREAFTSLTVNRSVANIAYEERVRGNERTWAPKITTIENLSSQLRERMGEARAASTWANLSSQYKQFVEFVHGLEVPEGESVEMTTLLLLFLEAKLESGIKKSTAKEYSKGLAQTLRKLGHELSQEALTEYRRALDRQGARVPQDQAAPATRANIEAAMVKLTPDEAMGLMLAWKTCSRIGEIQFLLREHVEHAGTDKWIITFPYHKGDPFRLGTVIVTRLERFNDMFITHVQNLREGQQISSLTTGRASAVLQSISPNLSAHSVKRGALITLLQNRTPLSIIQHMAKHRDLETLLIYLPKREVALSLGIEDATLAL